MRLWIPATAVLAAVALAGCGGDDKKKDGTTTAATKPPPRTATFPGARPQTVRPPARVGQPVTVIGSTSVARPKVPLKVTVTKVLRNAGATTFQRSGLARNAKFVGIKLTIVNTGKATWAGMPANDAALIDNRDEQAVKGPDIESCGGPFAVRVELRPGERQRGCITYLMPKRRRPVLFQFNPDFPASQAGEWRLTRG